MLLFCRVSIDVGLHLAYTTTIISHLSTHSELEILVRALSWQVRTLLISLSRSFDSMNHNGKWMKPKAIRLSETQRCEIIAKLSKPNALSNWAMRQEYEVSEGAIRKSSLLMMKSSLLRHLLNSKVLLTSMVLKLYTALSSTSTTNYFAMMLKQKLDRCEMKCNDRLRHFCKMLIN